MPNRSLELVGRREQSAAAQTVDLKSKPRRKPMTLAMTPRLEEQIMYRWQYCGQLSRQISDGLRIRNREAVEAVIQRRMNGRGPVMPATRRAA